MKVSLHTESTGLPVGTNGVEFKIYDVVDGREKHTGDLRIGKATVEWRKTRGRAGSERKVSMKDLIAFLNGDLVAAPKPRARRASAPKPKPEAA